MSQTVTVMDRANVQRVDARRPSLLKGHRIIEGGTSVGGTEEPSEVKSITAASEEDSRSPHNNTIANRTAENEAMDTSNERETFERAGSIADESIGTVASTMRASDSGTSSVATMRSVGDTAESVAISSPSCRSRGTQGRRVDKKTTGNTGSRTSPPRTQEETLHLIRLRDEMINAKHTEVLLLSKQNQGLREGIDAVETEMASLHGVIDAKDEHVQKLRRECDRLRRDMKRLHVKGEEQKGQENAMEIAATQNTRLLKLLEQEELKREHVLSERDEARAEVGELKDRVRTRDEHHAKRSAKLEMKLVTAIGENMALREKYSGVDERLEKLESDLESTRKKALFERATSKDELGAGRQNQYILLSQLQGSRDELHRTKDCMEVKERELETCKQQSAELEMRLATVQSDLRTTETDAREREVKADEDATLLAARLTKENRLSERLHDKVASMSRTNMRLTDRHKELHAEVKDITQKFQAFLVGHHYDTATYQVLKHEGEGKRLHNQIQNAGNREQQLKQKIIRLESGLSLELTQKRLHGAIDTFNSQIKTPTIATSCVHLKSSSCAGSAPEEHGATFGMGDVAWSRRQLLLKYIWHFKDMANQVTRTPGYTPKVGRHFGEELDLSECGLEDSDVDELMDTVTSCPSLTTLDLSMNHIGDAGAASVASALRQASCNLVRINLRCNQIGMGGVRELARALEENSSRGVSHVYVHREGRIDALGIVNPGSRMMDDQRPEKSSSASFVSVAVIDIADNNPDYSESNSAVTRANKTTRSGSSNKPLSLVCSHCRGKKKGGGSIAGIDGGIGHTMGGRRNEGVDNVRAIARQRNVRHVMTKAVYLEGVSQVTLPLCNNK